MHRIAILLTTDYHFFEAIREPKQVSGASLCACGVGQVKRGRAAQILPLGR
jgi:hypothetical protein